MADIERTRHKADSLLPGSTKWYDDLKAEGVYEKPRYEDEARSLLQVWLYDPKICGDEYVDRFSLYLSLREDDDPRVMSAAEELLEEVKWL